MVLQLFKPTEIKRRYVNNVRLTSNSEICIQKYLAILENLRKRTILTYLSVFKQKCLGPKEDKEVELYTEDYH
jgi:hypothetical protein